MDEVPTTLNNLPAIAYRTGKGKPDIYYVRPHRLFNSYYYEEGDTLFVDHSTHPTIFFLKEDKTIGSYVAENEYLLPPVTTVRASATNPDDVHEAYLRKLDSLCLLLLIEAGKTRTKPSWAKISEEEILVNYFDPDPVFLINGGDYVIGVSTGRRMDSFLLCVRKELTLYHQMLFTSNEYMAESVLGLVITDRASVCAIPRR